MRIYFACALHHEKAFDAIYTCTNKEGTDQAITLKIVNISKVLSLVLAGPGLSLNWLEKPERRLS